MDVLFVYEDRIARDKDGNYYTGSAFSQEVFDRYLEHFDRMILLMREANVRPDDEETLKRMNRVDRERVSVVLLPDRMADLGSFLSPAKKRRFRRAVVENITTDRAVILRAPSESGYIAARRCAKLGKPYLAEAVGCPWDSMWNHSLRGKVLAPNAWRRMRYIMGHAPYAVYVTERFLQRRYPTGGVSAAISDVELQPMEESVLAARLERQSARREKLVLGTAGAVDVRFKGQEYAIRALAKLKKRGLTGFEYRLAGGGDNSRLKALARRLGVGAQVVFEGSLPHREMFPWLDGLDVYLQPSLQDGLPRALVEAMSRALPALGSRIGGIPELLGEDATFPAKDAAALAERLAALDRERMDAMARDNFARAGDFGRNTMERKRSEFYQRFAEAAEGVRV